MSTRPWTVLAVVLLGTFLGAFNNSVASVLLPDVLESFPATSVSASGLLFTAFIYPTAVLVPLAGRLQDRLGVRPLFVGGLLASVFACLLCALAPSFGWLIVGRALQGLVVASVLPAVFAAASLFAPDERGRALGVWAAVNGGSLTAGPLLGGALVSEFGWRGVFAFDVAVSLATFAAAHRLVPNIGVGDQGRIDYAGASLLIGALLGLLGTLTAASGSGVASLPALAGAAITVGLGVTWFVTATRHRAPFLDPRLYREGTFGVLNAIIGLQMLVLFGVFFAVPLMLVTEHGISNGRAGAVMSLTPLVSTLLAPFAGRLADRVGTRTPVVCGAAMLCVAGAFLAASVTAGVRLSVVGLVLAGAGISVIQSPVAAEVTRVVPAERAGLAVGIFNSGRLVSGAIGTAVFTLVFQLAASISPGESMDAVPPQALAAGFRAVFVGMSVAGALALVLALAHGRRFWRPPGPAGERSKPTPGLARGDPS